MRREPSLPTWEVMIGMYIVPSSPDKADVSLEPENSSEDGHGQDEGNATANAPPSSTQPTARPKPQPKPRRRELGGPPPSTQPAPSTSRISDVGLLNRARDRLAMLNKPGKQSASAAASAAMSPPTQSTSQAPRDLNQTSISFPGVPIRDRDRLPAQSQVSARFVKPVALISLLTSIFHSALVHTSAECRKCIRASYNSTPGRKSVRSPIFRSYVLILQL